ncbi:MAG: histidine kinase [Lachnospiraceae bacterium]|nr:histidine kinase [Lachnospiraceae bacterium]
MKKKYITITFMILPILSALICLIQVVKNNNQALMPKPVVHEFTGEYSYDGENWYEYHKESDLSALKGDVIVKGHFNSEILEGDVLNLYCNHIGVSIYVNGELLYIDTPAEIKNYGIDLMASMCGKRWEQVLCPMITPEDEIQFEFLNYHSHGNENAYREVLSSFLITPQDNTILQVYLETFSRPFEMAGYALFIIGVMLLGAAISGIVFKSSGRNFLFQLAITTLFTAGYLLLDVMMTFFMNELLAVKTYGVQLCLMLAVYFLGWMLYDTLKNKYKIAAGIFMCMSGMINFIIIILAVMGKVLLYDTIFFWKTSQYFISFGLIILCILEIKRETKAIKELLPYLCINIAILLDISGFFYSMYYSGRCFKITYVAVLIFFLLKGAKQVLLDHQASLKNKKLKEELEQSRIAVMLSQIQPHFLYNSLSSVMDLCDSNPKQAKAAIADFADYLRGNLSSLKTTKLISFSTELEHIEKYLRLEKLRFQEELEIVYDIRVKDFMLPPLSVQPLVENAVKHGVGKKTGGGTVSIHTCETNEDYIICITDDGAGFCEEEYAKDGSTHIGIENIKRRLDMMMDAYLEIESKKGEGTTARIRIPIRRD